MFGRLRHIYIGMFKEFLKHRKVEQAIYDYGDLFIRWGFFVLNNGMVVKYNSSGSDVDLRKAKKLAMKVGLKTVAYRNGNIYLYNHYSYYTKKNVMYYVVFPLIAMIGTIIWLS